MDRGCSVPGLAAILRAVEGRHEESRALRELQEEKFRFHDYWMKAGLGQMVGLPTVRSSWAQRRDRAPFWVAGWEGSDYKAPCPHLS